MPGIPIDIEITVIQVRAQWTYARSGSGESSWSFVLPRAESDPQGVVYAAFDAHLQDLFRAARPRTWRLEQVLVEDRWPHELPTLVVDVREGPLQDDPQTGLPPQVTPIVSWRSGLIGRSQRGRTYWGPCELQSCETENVLDPALSAVYDFAESMMLHFTGVIPGTAPHFAIVSRIAREVPYDHGSYSLVAGYYFLERFGVVRRRLGYDWRT